MFNILNLVEQIPQQWLHIVETELNDVLDATTGDMLEHWYIVKGPDRDIWKN